MKKNRNNDQVGDTQAPALMPHEKGFRATDGAAYIVATPAPRSARSCPVADLAKASKAKRSDPSALVTCKQTLWFSFFFDGTGNNLDADEGTLKHSNVAKLYRAHMENNKTNGIYRLYIPGVGTYFKEVGDPGGTDLGLGTGKFGQERLTWALQQFDKYLAKHVERAANPTNDIVEINVAAFGLTSVVARLNESLTDKEIHET
jgi:hypothetical protein